MDVPILGEKTEEKLMPTDGPKVRLLFCFVCKTLEELPDFEGNPADDHLLQILAEKHTTTDIPHKGQLMRVPLKLWVVPDIKDAITKQIFDKSGAAGLDAISPGFYATKNQFAEDAMTCWRQHNRPKGDCADYGSDKKILRPNTAAERKELGLAPVTEGPKNYLCQFCPNHAAVVTKKREKSGFYK